MTIRQKLIESYIVSILENKIPSYELICNKKQLVALAESLYTTRCFENSLNDENNTLSEVISSMKTKHKASLKFKGEFGFDWPL